MPVRGRRHGWVRERGLCYRRMSSAALLAPFPLLLVLALLGSGRLQALGAGLAGLAAALGAALWLALQAGGWPAALALLGRELPAGLWLAWPVLAIIVPGVFFHLAAQAYQARLGAMTAGPGEGIAVEGALSAPATPIDPRRLWSLCFLLAPFAEAVTGFGVGYLIALAALRTLGLHGLPALLLGLFSQTLVPWGALAVGTELGARLAGISPTEMGERAALLQMLIHLGYLILYWRFARQAGFVLSAADRVRDALWMAALMLALWAANRYVDLEIGGLLACGLVIVLHEAVQGPARGLRSGRTPAAVLRAALPLILAAGLLCLSRVPPIHAALRGAMVWEPIAGQPEFFLLASPAWWLVVAGAALVLIGRGSFGALLGQTARLGWRPSAVTWLFVLMAQCYVGAGFADRLAIALQTTVGAAALLVVPLFAAVAGFLTGTGAASNAMLMPMVTALATQSGVSVPWMAAVQATVSTNLTALSPMRVAMGTAFDAGRTGEAALYRVARVLAAPAVLAGLALVLVLLLESGRR